MGRSRFARAPPTETMKLTPLVLAIGASACAVDAPDLATTDQAILQKKAVRLGGVGYVDTDAEFSKFWDGPFTISAWIDPEFAYGYYGPIFTSSKDASFWLGMGDYRLGSGGYKKVGCPVLSLKIDDQLLTYEVPELHKRLWNHLALVRTAPDQNGMVSYQVWVNGAQQFSFMYSKDGMPIGVNPDHTESLDADSEPGGWLRLGRNPKRDYQFYGLVDDVRVYDQALDPKALFVAGLNVDPDAKPIFAYGFDEDGDGSSYQAGYVLFEDAVRGEIDGSWFDQITYFDLPKFASPTQIDYQLPFPAGETWRVLQEFDEPGGSHNGFAAWSWDFVRAEDETIATIVSAPAEGRIYKVFETDIPTDGSSEGNGVRISHVPGWEASHLLHLFAFSFTEVFLQYQPTPMPDPDDPATWLDVQAGDEVGRVGPNAEHLHFAMQPGEDAKHTMPVAFVDYWASNDEGDTWYPVERGMPRKGQWLIRF